MGTYIKIKKSDLEIKLKFLQDGTPANQQNKYYEMGKIDLLKDLLSQSEEMEVWHEVNEGSLPEDGVEVFGYSPQWIHPDFNLKGIRVCFINEDEWHSAKWENNQDHWHTHAEWCCGDNGGKDFNPTHFMNFPNSPTANNSISLSIVE